MPVVTVQLWEGRTTEQKRALVSDITEAVVTHAGADSSGLHVVLQEVSPENWARAGVLGIDRNAKHEEKQDIVRLSHLLLQVQDLEAAERFYVSGLGFNVRKRDTFSDGRSLIVLKEGMGLVEKGPRLPGPIEHFAFLVRGLDSYKQRVEAAGGEVLEGPAPGAYGRSLYFKDLDGNKIEFHGD